MVLERAVRVTQKVFITSSTLNCETKKRWRQRSIIKVGGEGEQMEEIRVQTVLSPAVSRTVS